MKIIAEKVSGKDLIAGDLFSTADQFYWDHFDPSSIRQQVYIRTDAPCPPDQVNEVVYHIEIIRHPDPEFAGDLPGEDEEEMPF